MLLLIELSLGQQNDSVDKVACQQDWSPEFGPWNPTQGKKGTDFHKLSLTSTCTLDPQINVIKNLILTHEWYIVIIPDSFLVWQHVNNLCKSVDLNFPLFKYKYWFVFFWFNINTAQGRSRWWYSFKYTSHVNCMVFCSCLSFYFSTKIFSRHLSIFCLKKMPGTNFISDLRGCYRNEIRLIDKAKNLNFIIGKLQINLMMGRGSNKIILSHFIFANGSLESHYL